jgi:flagellar basal body rod protein FlgC
MIDLISASREFETNLNMLKLQDDGLAQLLQGVRQ